jgi:hypothetical protein
LSILPGLLSLSCVHPCVLKKSSGACKDLVELEGFLSEYGCYRQYMRYWKCACANDVH